jgi:hypothetical protein
MSKVNRNFFQEIELIIRENTQAVAKLPAAQKEQVLHFLDHTIRTNLEVIQRTIQMHKLPSAYKEIFEEIERLLLDIDKTNRLINKYNAKKGGRMRTMRGGGGAGTPNYGNLVKRAEVSAKIAAHGRQMHNNIAATQRIQNARMNHSVEIWTKRIYNNAGRIMKLLGILAVVGMGANFAGEVAGTAGYVVAKVSYGTQQTINMIPFIGEVSPPTYAAIPEPLMEELVTYNIQQEAQGFTFFQPSIPDERQNASVTSMVRAYASSAQEYTDALGFVMGDSFVSTEWPSIKTAVVEGKNTKQQALNTCRATKGNTTWYSFSDPCAAEVKAVAATKGSVTAISGRLESGSQLAPDVSTVTENTATFVSSIGDALIHKGETQAGEQIKGLVGVFRGVDGVGLEEGTGRFAPPLLADDIGYGYAVRHCEEAIESKVGNSGGIVKKAADLLSSACKLQITKYAKTSREDAALARMGSHFRDVIDTELRSENRGLIALEEMFTKQRDEVADSQEKAMYNDMIQAVREMDLVGIRFPTKERDIIRWAKIIIKHFQKYKRAGKTVPLKNTREYEFNKYAKSWSGSPYVMIIGGIVGLGIGTTIATLFKLAVLASSAPLLAAAVPGQFLMNIFRAGQRRDELGVLEHEVRKQIADGTLSPEKASRMLAAMGGGQDFKQLLTNAAVVSQVARIANAQLPRQNARRLPAVPAVTNVAPSSQRGALNRGPKVEILENEPLAKASQIQNRPVPAIKNAEGGRRRKTRKNKH